ncbi:MAG: triple tyrosine motif-containing protein, partial [Bacteroidota bacterium]
MYKSLRIPFIDKYNRPWVNFAGRIFIFDPEGETFEEVFTEFPKECVEIEDGNIWCTTVNGLLNYSFPHETKKPQIQYILNRSYHSDLFPFLAELLQGSNRIFQIENDPFTTPSKKYKITIEDSSDYLFFAVHPKNQTFHISQFGKKIWRSDDSLKTNTKSVPTRSISYGTVSLSVGNYELEISGESQPWTKPHKQSIPSNSEYEYRGVSLFKLSPSQTQLFDSIELDFQQNKFRPLPPFPNSQWLSQIEDSLFWYANPTYGFQEVVLKDGVMLKRKIIADTLFHSGEIKTWLTQHYLPLDKRFVLMIGGNNIGRLTNGKILYPMAILDTEEEKLISVKHDLSKSSFLNPGYGYIAYRIHRDANGDFWMGTSSHGLLKFRLPDNWEKEEQIDLQIEHINLIEIEKASYESSTHVTDVSPDPYGNLWASSHTNGIFKIEHDATNISKLSYPDWINTTKFKSEMIEWGGSLWVDKKDKVWISQYPNHLGWFNDSTNTFEKFTTTGENFSENYRGILYEDGQENFWAFSKGECLYKINKRTYTVDKIPFPEGSRINKVFEDVKGQLWATDVHANFYKIDPVLLNISPFNMYSEGTQVRKWDGLWTVQNDKKGNTWMSFHAGGLGKLSYEKLPSGRDSIIFEEFIPSMRCIAISIDKKGKLWLGHPDGIYVFDPEKEEIVKTIGKKEGFDGNWVLGLFIDKHDRIWFIANSTLGFYDQVQQKTFVPEALSNLKLFEPSSISSKGVLTTAALDGIIRVGINTFQLDNTPPSVLIEKIITQGQDKKNQLNLIYTEDRTKQIDFPWSENSLEIQYTGIHYDDPVENRFQYQLVGVDDDWIDVGQERIARYPNLPSGTYTFQVKAVNANGFWSEATSVTFRVLPPWWRTWWAYTLYILAIASLVYAFYKFQLNRQLAEAEANKFREIDEVKSRLYTNITHEFRTPLTIIDGLTDQIKGFDKLRHIIKRNTGQLLNLVNQLLDLAKMEEGKLSID